MILAMQKSSLNYGITMGPWRFFASEGRETKPSAAGLNPQFSWHVERVIESFLRELPNPTPSFFEVVQQLKAKEMLLNGGVWTAVEQRVNEKISHVWSLHENFRDVSRVRLQSLIREKSRPLMGVDVIVEVSFRAPSGALTDWIRWSEQRLPEVLHHETLDQWLKITSLEELASALLQYIETHFSDVVQVKVIDRSATHMASL